MRHQILFGNRLMIRRIDLTPEKPAERTIFITEEISEDMKKKLPYYTCEVVMIGTGRAITEHFPQLRIGSRLCCDNRMGSVKLPDGLEVISLEDILSDISEPQMPPQLY